jgi:hypothetical protein
MVKKTDEDWWRNEKILFGLIIILGYVFGWILTGFLLLTPEQAQLYSQGMATLGPIVGVIAGAIWKFAKDELEERRNLAQTNSVLADKIPPATVPKEELTYGPIETITIEGATDGSTDAPWYTDDDSNTDPSA